MPPSLGRHGELNGGVKNSKGEIPVLQSAVLQKQPHNITRLAFFKFWNKLNILFSSCVWMTASNDESLREQSICPASAAAAWQEALCVRVIHLSIGPSFYHEGDFSRTPGGNFLKCSTNVLLDSWVNGFNVGGQRSRSLTLSVPFPWKQYIRNTSGGISLCLVHSSTQTQK